MKVKIAIYRHLPRDYYIDSLKIEEREIDFETKIIKDQIVPGILGLPDLYVRKYILDRTYNDNTSNMLLITYTYQPLSEEKLKEIKQRIKRFAQELR